MGVGILNLEIHVYCMQSFTILNFDDSFLQLFMLVSFTHEYTCVRCKVSDYGQKNVWSHKCDPYVKFKRLIRDWTWDTLAKSKNDNIWIQKCHVHIHVCERFKLCRTILLAFDVRIMYDKCLNCADHFYTKACLLFACIISSFT